jgi:RNA polymerase primary sigma factor
MQDVLSGPDELRPELFAIRQLKLQSIEKALSKLSKKEKSIIRLRYGLDCERAPTFEDIGKLVDVSGERARQIHSKAIIKLREEKDLIECLVQQNLLTRIFQ